MQSMFKSVVLYVVDGGCVEGRGLMSPKQKVVCVQVDEKEGSVGS